MRRIVREADPELPITHVRTLDRLVAGETASRRTQLTLLASFAGLALTLAGLGIHGLLSSAVRQRSREIGLRLALGAERWDVLGLLLRRALLLAAIGGASGLALALLPGRGMRALLAGVESSDPWVGRGGGGRRRSGGSVRNPGTSLASGAGGPDHRLEGE